MREDLALGAVWEVGLWRGSGYSDTAVAEQGPGACSESIERTAM